MTLSVEASKRIHEIVSTAVIASLENDPSKEFILAILNERKYDPFSFFSGPSKTLLESETDRILLEMIRDILKEIFNSEMRNKLKTVILAADIEQKVFFAGRAAVNEFIDRVRAPIDGNLIKITLGLSDDDELEDDDE